MGERNYKRIESGGRKTIDLSLIDIFCAILHIPILKLFGIDEEVPVGKEVASVHKEIIIVQWEIIKSQRDVMDMLYKLTGTVVL